VVAGADHLDRPIRWVHAGEVANMPAFVSEGELLLTTGMGMGATAADYAASFVPWRTSASRAWPSSSGRN
jgi:hypothetical protein